MIRKIEIILGATGIIALCSFEIFAIPAIYFVVLLLIAGIFYLLCGIPIFQKQNPNDVINDVIKNRKLLLHGFESFFTGFFIGSVFTAIAFDILGFPTHILIYHVSIAALLFITVYALIMLAVSKKNIYKRIIVRTFIYTALGLLFLSDNL